ncbi:hypothetical protein SCLCIDRAFT_29084 [Scleroderma citrinum Foug A]|uniref:Uncharacterized protein n=1 Tax=Scleroderma citrinum Foug A TaxID=1036808 RepID=A0A0C2Z5C5_9AGAM|nr:hypothetical protein SCLCIDRAFT_29084 [Scleroderma citrinum Foug A]
MSSKRKHSSQTATDSQFTVEDDAVSSQVKHQRPVHPVGSEPSPLAADTELGGQTRRSSRTGKGSGRQLQQLHNLERLQTAKHLRLSRCNLDMATQGQMVNPMAPDHCSDNDKASQILPWAP